MPHPYKIGIFQGFPGNIICIFKIRFLPVSCRERTGIINDVYQNCRSIGGKSAAGHSVFPGAYDRTPGKPLLKQLHHKEVLPFCWRFTVIAFRFLEPMTAPTPLSSRCSVFVIHNSSQKRRCYSCRTDIQYGTSGMDCL